MSEVIDKAAIAIIGACMKNKNITPDSLWREMEDGNIEGWLYLPAVVECNFSEWTRAMIIAADTIED